MFLSLVWQQLHTTVRALAIGQESINLRLKSAYIKGLLDLKPEDMPDDMKSDFDAIYGEITGENVGGLEETITNTIENMEPEEASKIALQIFTLFDVASQKYFLERESK